MPAAFSIRGRWLRAGTILLGGWLVLEIALIQLVAARIGWGATLAFLSIKGGIGLFLIGFLTIRGFSQLKPGAGFLTGRGSFQAFFGVASGILITLPGLIPPLLGVALFAPSLQNAILKRLFGAIETSSPREIDLDAGEWQEVRRRKPATKPRPRKPSLEAGPPSV